MIRRLSIFLAAVAVAALGITGTAQAASPCDVGDNQPPVVSQILRSARAVTISEDPASVTIKANVTEVDECDTGVDRVVLHAESVTGVGQWTQRMTRVGGDAQRGTYALTLDLPGYTTLGKWVVKVKAFDRAGQGANLDSGWDTFFRAKAAEHVTAYATTARVRRDGTVTIAGQVERYTPSGPVVYEPWGKQDVQVIYRAHDGRYLFSVVKSGVNVDSRGLWHVRIAQHGTGSYLARVLPTKTSAGAYSDEFTVRGR